MKKILIIDDDNRNIFALKAVLRSRGYECTSSATAREGIALLEQDDTIGIVLMDMMMPDMDGYEAISSIRQDDRLQDTPIIAVTAQAMQGDKEKCIAAGADAYISKPIDIGVMVGILDRYLKVV